MTKQIYNLDSVELYTDAKILGGNPSGIINYNRTPHKWAKSLWDIMRANTWHPAQVNTSADKVNYPKLSDADRRMFDLILAQLITNDSIQTNQLMDSINKYVTSPVVNACLSRQAYEEANHSESYSVMAEDICGDTDRIFSMHHHDAELAKKNKAVADMYALINNNESNITQEDILIAFGANQILEELVFPGGFCGIYAIGHVMPGSASMIAEIQKDENTHVYLFMNMFRTAVRENFNGVVPDVVKDGIHKMIKIMVEAEKRWCNYATKGVLGFSEASIKSLVEGKGNSVCKNLGLPLLYEAPSNNPLQKLLDKYDLSKSDAKDNFFEGNVAAYSKGTLVMDF